MLNTNAHNIEKKIKYKFQQIKRKLQQNVTYAFNFYTARGDSS